MKQNKALVQYLENQRAGWFADTKPNNARKKF